MVGAINSNNDFERLEVGGDFFFFEFFILRGGYNSHFLKDGEGGLSLGFGVNTTLLFSDTIFQFDYAYRDFGRLQNVHMFSLELKF